MENVSSFVFEFFMERHIVLKERWLSEVLSLVPSLLKYNKDVNTAEGRESIATLMFEQWLYTDMSKSTYPVLEQLGLCLDVNKICVSQPVVLQICSIVDIGASLYSQFCALVHEFLDNTGFEPLHDMERGHGMEDLEAKPRRMLSLTVSDGETKLKAVEYRSINSLSLLTKPGCKILLIPPIFYRKGVFLLTSKNVQVLGGDVESIFKDGRPLQVMSRRLNLAIPSSRMMSGEAPEIPSMPIIACENGTSEKVQNGDDGIMNGLLVHFNIHDMEHDHPRNDGSTVEINSHVTEIIERHGVIKKFPSENYHCGHHGSPLTAGSSLKSLNMPGAPISISKPIAQISPLRTKRQDLQSPLQLEDSPPDFDAALGHLQNAPKSPYSCGSSESDSWLQKPCLNSGNQGKSSIISLCGSQLGTSSIKETPRASYRRPLTLGIQNYLKSSNVSAPKQNDVNEVKLDVLPKKVKVEVVELDDEDTKPNELNLLTPAPAIDSNSPATTWVLNAEQRNPDDGVVVKFIALNVVHITDALKQMRFVVGSCRKSIQGIVVDIVKPLRIVDDMWTMKVTIQDVSIDSFVCIIDNSTLSTLIGLTPKEAMEIRASHDMQRREDGQRRLCAVEDQLKRLDLIMDVELFSGGRADPVIRRIRTLMQALADL